MQILMMFVLSIYMSFILFSHYVLSCGKFFHLLRPDFWLILTKSINSCTTRLNYKSEFFSLAAVISHQINKQKHSPCSWLHRMHFTELTFEYANNLISYITGISLLCGQEFSIQTIGQCLITLKKNWGEIYGTGI